ncbi:MAG: anhydro-N-acetylmuramic acid kinase, partial [Nonlabens sp.]|nr:anhydro-N-acetylmuramic acid kinase [Nonlabens sp.]
SQNYNVVGVMSGTSLDGVDLVHMHLVRQSTYTFHILHTQTVSYNKEWKSRLANAINLSEHDLVSLNKDYTQLLATIINEFISANHIKELVCVCSHGHTIYHEPALGRTLQIGNLPQLATLLQQRVVCDFRIADVALGGQGAPLVPIGDKLLFSDYTHCLNLGGFANISFEHNHRRVAFDICPVNVVLNHYALLLGKMYDEGGAFAKAGKVNTAILKQLNDLEYYHLEAPKSLGMEWVNEHVWKILDQLLDEDLDKLATFTEHIAIQIVKAVGDATSVLVTGGGAYNTFLLQRLSAHSKTQFIVPQPAIVEFKEAIIFGLLGVLRLRNEPNCLASVTGAPYDHISGVVYVP